jgi:L-asparagine transporter-like permease
MLVVPLKVPARTRGIFAGALCVNVVVIVLTYCPERGWWFVNALAAALLVGSWLTLELASAQARRLARDISNCP